MIKDSPDPVSIQGTKTILNQAMNCICKIKINTTNATGFFCQILYKNNLIKSLMTNYHVIDEEIYNQNEEITLFMNDEKVVRVIKLGNNRITYFDKNYDLALIEIKENDNINNFLELDDNLFKEEIKAYFKDISVYTLHYPLGKNGAISYGLSIDINNYQIKHTCSTEHGSSGSPILNLSNNKVIGIHKQAHKQFNFNMGTLLKFPLNDFLQKKNNNINNSNLKKSIKLNISKEIFNEQINVIKEKISKNIKLLKEFKLTETIYSMCFLEKHQSLVLGLEKKIDLYDKKLTYKTSFSKLDGKIAYIKELWNGKILIIDLTKKIKILKLDNNEINLESSIETADKKNFVGIGLSNQNIICGGDRYLSIIGRSFLYWYKMVNSIDLQGFISNIVEINPESFLVGQSHNKRIIIFSSKTYEKLYEINNIYLRGNNYSISKISNKFVGIAGYGKHEDEKNIIACLFLLSIESKKIIKKFYYNDLDNFSITNRLNDNEIITSGNCLKSKDYSSDIILLNITGNYDNVDIKKISELKKACFDSIEALISFENLIIVTDSSSNLKLFEVK